MDFSQTIEKFNNSNISKFIEKAFSSYVFPFVTAAVTVLSTTFGLEPLIVWYICICGAAISLCCKDVSPVICLFVFMHVCISMQHSPDKRVDWCDPAYLTSPAFLAQAIVAVLLLISTVIYRIADSIIKKRFKITPLFIGLVAYFTALALNGLFSSKYYFMDTLYGLGMGAIILFMFVYVSGNVVINESTYKRIAFIFVALCLTLALQLMVTYITLDVVQDGVIQRGFIMFGWGTYNQFGMLITLCIPSWFYLAAKYKYGFAFLFGVPFNLVVAVFGMSRQSILMAAVLTILCCVWYLIIVPKRQKLYGGAFMSVAAVVALIVILINKDNFANIFSGLAASFITGSGRSEIWEDGLKKFLHNPIFGNGFYDLTATEMHMPGYNGESYGFTQVIPFMCHNTFIQLLFAGGVVGLIAYLIHRVQTVVSLFNNPCAGRFFIMFTMCGILLTSLLDNHIFYPLPLFIYAPLLAVFALSEKGEKTEIADDKENNANTAQSACVEETL